MPKQVRAKFAVTSIELNGWGKIVHMSAVTGGSNENKDFNTATPSGNLSIGIHGDVPAVNFFEVGKEFYMDFTPAD